MVAREVLRLDGRSGAELGHSSLGMGRLEAPRSTQGKETQRLTQKRETGRLYIKTDSAQKPRPVTSEFGTGMHVDGGQCVGSERAQKWQGSR